MTQLKQVWDWLDGNKTTIGAGIALAAKVASLLDRQDLATVLSDFSAFVIAGGLTHKVVKAL